MPYKLEKDGNKYFVVDDTGKRYSDKPLSKWRASSQMRALWANETKKGKEFVMHDGAMVAIPIPEAFQLVENLSFSPNAEVLPPYEMHVTLSYLGDIGKLDILPDKLFSICETFAAKYPPVIGTINGYGVFTQTHLEGKECLWLSFDAPALPEIRQELLKVLSQNGVNIESNHGFTPHITVAYYSKGEIIPKLEFEPKQVLIRFLRVAWGDMVKEFPFNGVMKEAKENGFHVFKQADGSYRWVTISSSAFRDRDGEIVTAKALAEDVERCDTNKSYGPLRWWHVGGWEAPDGLDNWQTWRASSGVDIGACDFNMLHGKMLIESGTFKDKITGEAFSQVQDNLEVSIAFSHPPTEPGTAKQYQNIHRFERSLLPSGMASNLLTKFYIAKGNPDMKTTEKLAALVAILKGKPDLAQQILADAEGVQKAAEDAGLEYKEVETLISGEPEAVTEEVIQPSAVTEAAPVVAEVAPVVETAPIVEKAAPPAPAPEPVEIGDWTPEQLTAFIMQVMKASMGKKEADEAAVIEPIQHTLKQATEAITALSGQVTTLQETLTAQQQELHELTDSRPVGIKQMQQKRATASESNVIANAPTGPKFDPDFMTFLRGGN